MRIPHDTVGHVETPEPVIRARSLKEAEQRHDAARDAWTAAMRAAASGRPADLASLAIAQQAYEEALEEREQWHSGAVAIPIDPHVHERELNAAIRHGEAWQQVLHHEEPAKRFSGLRRVFGRRSRD
jgi:hypothetical protein